MPPPSPPPPLGVAAGSSAAGSGSRPGTPAGSLAELRDAQERTADALQLVAEEVERQGGVQVQQPALHIGDQCFASEDAAWALIKQLKRDLLDRPVRWDNQEQSANFRFLLGLLGRHPKGAAKVPHLPVTAAADAPADPWPFVSRENAFGTGIEFHFIDACGCEQDFSALKCMKQRQEPPAAKLAGAMSAAIRENKAAFRRSCPHQWCQLCGAGSRAQLVVEHNRPTLPQLRADFLKACRHRHLPVPTEFAAEPGSNTTIFRAVDGEFAEMWRQYHAQHACLRLLCKTCLWAENERRGIRQCKGRLLPADH
ncbi:La domain-containing [Chlorella sorokiniana]|uniref:La domain-containing n=1 Tax=Chlorella sorokiniana TaxID=3076 RepID=A0A2P6U304_CHLSO|nr:La domain-containing [Chlorella sorokiniana]|eukprot:PRW60696.1 La domain-containing [Chlorella sorokiniana]